MRNFIITYLMFLCVGINAQDLNSNYKLDKRKLAEFQITELKHGVLLVRLKTRINSINAMRKAGKNEMANQLEAQQKVENIEIIEGFEKEFTFCPVYFFYSHDSKLVLEGKFKEVVFLDNKLAPDPTVQILLEHYFIAEFAKVEQNDVKEKEDTYYAPGKDGLEKKETYVGGTNFGFGALIIRDKNFKQLSRPFPYYSRTLDSIKFLERRKFKTIRKFNENLFEFY